MRAVLLSLLVLLIVACGAYRFPGQTPSGTGTVSGHVTVVPCSPVQAAKLPPCAGRPAAGLEIDFTGNGTAVGTRTDSSGAYSVELPAGTWKVSFKSYMRIISGPPTVKVQAGSGAVADYVVDSGIRVPIAKEPSQTPTLPRGALVVPAD
ncbi:MAG TPA: hypothetical protein VGA76_06745 [Candidatus Dormibacteraeota bacterium]